MAIQKAEAFILNTHPFRTSSLIVTAFSRPFGKVKGLVKGVRREGVVRPGTFEPFNLLEIVYYEKIRSEIHLISEAAILETFEPLRRDLETLATAYYLVELVDQLTETQDPHEAIFELLHFAFQFLPSLPLPLFTRFFEVRLLYETGFLPHLGTCLGCGAREMKKTFYSARQGAIFCEHCRSKAPEARPVHPQVLESIGLFMDGEISEAVKNPLKGEVEKELKELVERFLSERLGRPLRTRRFLNQVRSLKHLSFSPRSSK